MKKFITVAALVAGFSIDAHAAASAPIQRIDIVNLIGTSAAPTLQSPITVKFFVSGASTACYTATLPYNGSATFYAGTGLACSAGVANITAVPGTSPGSNQVVYAPLATTGNGNTASVPVPTGNGAAAQFYNTQIEITPDSTTAPAFSATTGVIQTAGAIKATYQQSN